MRLTRFAGLGLLLAGFIFTTGCSHFRGTPDIYFAEPESVGMSAEALQGIRPAIQPFIESGKLAGAATLVARDGKIVNLDAFGYRDFEAQLPMETDTIFRMYSMTKPVTAVAVMQLVDRGKVELSDPVSKFIPEFAEMKVLSKNEDGSDALIPAEVTMTVEHLMTHTSGLSYGFLNPVINPYYQEAGVNDFANQSLEDFARKAGSVPLLCEPGTQWNYSIGMDVLGRVVEVASGLPYDVYLQKNLFGPLGMEDSGFYVPQEKLDRFAQVYTHNADKTGTVVMDDPLVGGFKTPPMMASGGGGMVGTIGDYYRFAQMLLNRGELDGVRVLSEESAWEITRDHLGPGLGNMPLATLLNARVTVTESGGSAEEAEEPGSNSLRAMIFRGMGFGYCGAVVRPDALPIFGSPGVYWWGGLASTDFWIDPQENLVAIFCTQLIPAGTYPTKIAFSGAVYKAIEERHMQEMAAQ